MNKKLDITIIVMKDILIKKDGNRTNYEKM